MSSVAGTILQMVKWRLRGDGLTACSAVRKGWGEQGLGCQSKLPHILTVVFENAVRTMFSWYFHFVWNTLVWSFSLCV